MYVHVYVQYIIMLIMVLCIIVHINLVSFCLMGHLVCILMPLVCVILLLFACTKVNTYICKNFNATYDQDDGTYVYT